MTAKLTGLSVQGQGTEEQKAKWLPLAESCQIIGTYAQTELGHGKFSTQVYTDKYQLPPYILSTVLQFWLCDNTPSHGTFNLLTWVYSMKD